MKVDLDINKEKHTVDVEPHLEVAGARLAHVSLELGGKSPSIVFPDAGTPDREFDSGEDFLAYLEAVIEDPSGQEGHVRPEMVRRRSASPAG